jgi:hypothetical protein
LLNDKIGVHFGEVGAVEGQKLVERSHNFEDIVQGDQEGRVVAVVG